MATWTGAGKGSGRLLGTQAPPGVLPLALSSCPAVYGVPSAVFHTLYPTVAVLGEILPIQVFNVS